MREDCVERCIGEGQAVHVALLILEIHEAPLGRVLPGGGQCRGREVEADHLTWRQSLGQPPRDAPRAAADIEQPHAGAQLGQKERRGFLGGSPSMMAYRRGRVAVDVLFARCHRRRCFVPGHGVM
jgi:hypothetical protein